MGKGAGHDRAEGANLVPPNELAGKFEGNGALSRSRPLSSLPPASVLVRADAKPHPRPARPRPARVARDSLATYGGCTSAETNRLLCFDVGCLVTPSCIKLDVIACGPGICAPIPSALLRRLQASASGCSSYLVFISVLPSIPAPLSRSRSAAAPAPAPQVARSLTQCI